MGHMMMWGESSGSHDDVGESSGSHDDVGRI